MTLRVLAVPGSLRADSFNRRLLHAAIATAPPILSIELFDGLGSLPPFDEDAEAASAEGPAVRTLRDRVRAADGLLIATPEYNQSLPGVLKNAVDWLSRAGPDEVLDRKPVAIVGASTGPWGTRLAQAALRQTLFATGALVLPAPALYLAHAASAFDVHGRLRDEATAGRLRTVLDALSAWIVRSAPPV